MSKVSLFKRTPLLNPDILERFRDEQKRVTVIPSQDEIFDWIDTWINSTVKKSWTEPELEQTFNQKFFCSILEYSLGPEEPYWSAWPKPSKKHTGLDGEPDIILGHFNPNKSEFSPIAVVELKKPRTALDAPQPGYDNKSPVEQAFEYAENLPPSRWVIVSDMVIIRLYGVDDMNRFHIFDLRKCINIPSGKITNQFKDLYFLLNKNSLIKGGSDSKTARLVKTSGEKQLSCQEGFYQIYSQIRLDLLDAVSKQLDENGKEKPKKEIIESVQRLLDRLIFIYFCEDHPDRLLPNNLVKNVVKSALHYTPGSSKCKAYQALKQLFRDIDKGATAEEWEIPRYNGELFKYHPIVDEVDIPDKLANKTYQLSSKLESRTINGVWGLHEFDFWRELGRDLLGNIFEKSIADLAMLSNDSEQVSIADTLQKQKDWGIFYTHNLLAKFVAESVVGKYIDENAKIQSILTALPNTENGNEFKNAVKELLHEIEKIKIVDLACGSGVFLTAALDNLLKPFRKGLEVKRHEHLPLTWEAVSSELSEQSEITQSTIHGIDLLPQAVELAKLALWLTAVKKNEVSSDLSDNFIAGNSLAPSILNNFEEQATKGFDIVLGNPPWGGKYNEDFALRIMRNAGLEEDENWDSWEIFIALAWDVLKEGGRLGLVLPDTLHSSEKIRIRNFLLKNFSIEKLYNMGPDWFGPRIRMGTVVLQATKKTPKKNNLLRGLVLSGDPRRKAIRGSIPLKQIESKLSHSVLQKRAQKSETGEVRVFCSEYDHKIMNIMNNNSEPLYTLTDRSRGEEMNAEGHFWKCSNCNGLTVPGRKRKGGEYASKNCPFCGLELTSDNTRSVFVVSEAKRNNFLEPYIDGKLLNHRYEALYPKWIRTNLSPIEPSFKDKDIYKPPKLFIRQAGVGVTATLSYDWSRCPQSVYLYRCTKEAEERGYTNEFILACLVSRTMNYYLLKRFGEVDPARAHVKLTHSRLENLPIPSLENQKATNLTSEITKDVKLMLKNQNLGSETDHRIELNLRKLWKIKPEEGAYINQMFSIIPESQTVKDLFPTGPPKMLDN